MILKRQKEYTDNKDSRPKGKFWTNEELESKLAEERQKAADKAVSEYAKTEEGKAIKKEAEKKAKEKLEEKAKKAAEREAKREAKKVRLKRVAKWAGVDEEKLNADKEKIRKKISGVAKWMDRPENAKKVRRGGLATVGVLGAGVVARKVVKKKRSEKPGNDIKKKVRGYEK